MSEAKQDKFVWFQGQSVTELTERLTRATDHPRLEIRERDGEYYLRVVDGEVSKLAEGDINFSHVCPPHCPS